LTDNQKIIIHAMSLEIAAQATSCAGEQMYPAKDPDASEEYIKQKQKSVRDLRLMREELEDLFTGITLK